MRRLFLIAIFAAGAAAQTGGPAKPATAQSQGVPEVWDTRTMARNLQSLPQRLKPVLDQIHPENWVSQGAPHEYVTQLENTQAELRYFQQSSDAFIKEPERLPLALDTYFRMQSLDTMLGSLIQGIRRYQNPAVGDLVQGIISENSGNRDRLRDYIRELATEKEQEFKIADREAQRCRGAINRESTTRKTK
jgi:hypothetical protein